MISIQSIVEKFDSLQVLHKEILKFFFFGVVNNLSLILLYQILLFFINYKISAVILYVFAFFLNLYVNSTFVFKNNTLNLSHKIKYAAFYILLCTFSYYTIVFFTSILDFNPRINIFFVVLISSLINFVLSRKILKAQVSGFIH